MKYFTLNSILSLDLNVYYIEGTKKYLQRWGKQQNYNVLGIYQKHIIILKLLPIFLDLKKIILITNRISFNFGICVSCLLRRSNLNKNIFLKKKIGIKKKNFRRKRKQFKIFNFYFIFLDQWYGFISNFIMFKKFKRYYPRRCRKITNYRRTRLPDIVLMTEGSWKYHDYIFDIFFKLRLISIKCGSYIQNDINVCYNILIGNYFMLYKVLRNIYAYHRLLRRKRW